MRPALVLCTTLAALAACAEFPALEGRVTPAVADLPPPALVPLGPVLSRATTATQTTAATPADLSARVAALRSRAARLRGPVIPAATRARMLRGVR